MDIGEALLSFAAVAALLTMTPGLDTALILRTSLLAGKRPAWGVSLGIQLGTLLWGVLAAAGLAALLAASRPAYEVLRWAGVAYLVWMGVRMILAARRDGGELPERRQEVAFWRAFGRGLTTNLLNPKVGAFYVAMLPHFIPDGTSPAVMGVLLAGVHVAEAMVWGALLIGFASLMSGFLRTPAVRRFLDRLTGVVIVGFGVRLAISD